MTTFMTSSGAGALGMSGQPIASAFESTSVRSFRLGYLLFGGFLPFVTHSSRATINARRVSVSGFGLLASISVVPAGCTRAKPPPRPPCAVPERQYRQTVLGRLMSLWPRVPAVPAMPTPPDADRLAAPPN